MNIAKFGSFVFSHLEYDPYQTLIVFRVLRLPLI